MKKASLLLIAVGASLFSLSGCGGSGASAPPKLLPTVAISTSASSATLGQSVTLTWTTTNATSCTASATPSASEWSGSKATSGSQTVTVGSAGANTFSLSCLGAGGVGSDSAAVTGTMKLLAISSGAPPTGSVGSLYLRRFACLFWNGRVCQQGESRDGFELRLTGGTGALTWTWAATAGSSLPPGLTITTRIYHQLALGTLLPYSATVIGGTPTSAGSYNVVVTVKDSASPPAQGSARYTIVIDNSLTINSTPAPPAGALNLPYSFTFSAFGGIGAQTWTETGPLPPGLTLSIAGVLSGTPTSTGSFPITVTVTDTFPQSVTHDFTVVIAAQGFSTTGSMGSSRFFHSATLLKNGKVLVAGGNGGNNSAELFDPGTGTFAPTGHLVTPRDELHTATLLGNGKVLITGGQDNGQVTAAAELFDPATGSFSATGSMATARYAHTATMLNNGKVLVAGGLTTNNSTDTAELYDPANGTFTSIGKMVDTRFYHTATLLNNGKVLLTGGLADDAQSIGQVSAELFDPATNSFMVVANMGTGRYFHTATLFQNGQVLVAGGETVVQSATRGLASAELFDPSTNSFSPTGSMTAARFLHTAVLLGNGTVLVAGGQGAGLYAMDSAELFDPASGTFSITGSMTTARIYHVATLLANGKVLITGGLDLYSTVLATAEIYP